MNISDIQKLNSVLGNKNYEKAFLIIYGNTITQVNDWKRIVEPLMKSDRCNGDFYKACRIYEKTIENEVERIAAAKKSKKVVEFRKKYANWESGYAMGEKTVIVFKTPNRTVRDLVFDNERYYSGRGNKYNKSVAHGSATLTVDLTGPRAKYSEEIIKK